MTYRLVVKSVTGPNTVELGVAEIVGDVWVGMSGVLEVRNDRGEIILAVPPGLWLHCEEAKLVQPVSQLVRP